MRDSRRSCPRRIVVLTHSIIVLTSIIIVLTSSIIVLTSSIVVLTSSIVVLTSSINAGVRDSRRSCHQHSRSTSWTARNGSSSTPPSPSVSHPRGREREGQTEVKSPLPSTRAYTRLCWGHVIKTREDGIGSSDSAESLGHFDALPSRTVRSLRRSARSNGT